MEERAPDERPERGRYHLKDYQTLDLTGLTYPASPRSQHWPVLYQERPLVITTPPLTGLVTGAGLDLVFPRRDGARVRQFHDLIEIVDIHHISQLCETPTDFGLEAGVAMSEIEDCWIPTVRKCGYTFDDCLKFRETAVRDLRFFDGAGAAVSPEIVKAGGLLDRSARCVALLHLAGIRRRGDYYTTDWRVWQVRWLDFRAPSAVKDIVSPQHGSADVLDEECVADTSLLCKQSLVSNVFATDTNQEMVREQAAMGPLTGATPKKESASKN